MRRRQSPASTAAAGAGVVPSADAPRAGPRSLGPRPAPPRTARGEATRQRLLDAAERLFGTRGFHDTSIVEITREAGVGHGTF